MIATHDKASNERLSIDCNATNNTKQPASIASIECDVLIIGAGLAGLSTALSLPQDLQVMVLAKEDLQACSSHYAQGGIAAVIDANDTLTEHVSDTVVAGDGLCHVAATTQILQQGSQAIDWLLAHDVPFTTVADTLTPSGSNHSTNENPSALSSTLADLHLTKEGGHGCRRVAHANDATGRHIMQSLIADVARAKNITLLPYHEAVNLFIDEGVCQGATVVNKSEKPSSSQTSHTIFEIRNDAVVLASGGLGQLFSRATAPTVCMGDGIMMAWEAGCRLANLEFVQFHPTGLAIANMDDDTQNQTSSKADRNFLISEALRGEGAYLLDPMSRTRFMPNYDKRAELAPRDIVARAIATEIGKNGLGYVHLDISHQPASFIQSHFPDIYAHCLSVGIDITTDPIPVAPTAHYTCGGIITTATGQTDVKGLYAAGEVAHTGLHGANRLASNSLLECVVVGRAIATHIPNYFKNKQDWTSFEDANSKSLTSLNVEQVSSSVPAFDLAQPFASVSLNFEDSVSSLQIQQLKQLMTEAMGIRRTEKQLSAALKQIKEWQQQNDINKSALSALRWQRLLTLASLMLLSALARVESRGGHYRNDYPTASDAVAISVIYPLQDLPKFEVVASQSLSSLAVVETQPSACTDTVRVDVA